MDKPSFEEFVRGIEHLAHDALARPGFPGSIARVESLRTLFNSLTSPDWTPVEKGLPPDRPRYHWTASVLVTTLDTEGEVVVAIAAYSYTRKRWTLGGVIAWAPLPQPYEPTDE